MKLTCTRFYNTGFSCKKPTNRYSEDYGAICDECLEELTNSLDKDIVNFMSGNQPKKIWNIQQLKSIFKEI